MLSISNAEPAPAKDTAGIKLVSVAEGATTTKPEALKPWVGGEGGRIRRHERARFCQRASGCLRHYLRKDLEASAHVGATCCVETGRQVASACSKQHYCKGAQSPCPSLTGHRDRGLGHKARTTVGATRPREMIQHRARVCLRCCQKGPQLSQ